MVCGDVNDLLLLQKESKCQQWLCVGCNAIPCCSRVSSYFHVCFAKEQSLGKIGN